MEVQRYARDGLDVILIGHHGHPEVEGTLGRFDARFGGRICLVQNVKDAEALIVRDPAKLAFVTQTTLSVDDTSDIVEALRGRFPDLETPRKEDICYATQNRQDAVKKLLEKADVLVVVGSRASSNSNRLRELADRAGIPGYLVDGAADMHRDWFDGKQVGPRSAGTGSDQSAARVGGEGARGDCRPRGACDFRPAARIASSGSGSGFLGYTQAHAGQWLS
jgi:4-hydroxy-3-methylbut-2-enyl diphosphate reductase